MTHKLKLAAASCALLIASTVGAFAESILTNFHGMTLYTFDMDKDGKSACADACATMWPPFAALADENFGEGWTMVDRADGTKQWAYDGKPVYFFVKDLKAGDMLGDGIKEVWHVIKE